MAGPIKGSIEHYFLGAAQTSGSAQTIFVNTYNFLNNNTGTLGIRRIAYHTGAKETGMVDTRAMNFYDAAMPAGNNAWACFCFSSASVPFYVLIQYSGNTGMGTAPGSPGLFKGAATTTAMGFAFASRADGGNPWNGSSGSNGFDTKGTPVWHPGTSSMALAPRSNDSNRAGAHGTNKQNLLGFSVGSNVDYRYSMVADYDNFVAMLDIGIDGSYQTAFLGTYTPLSGVNPQVSWVVFNDANVPLTDASVYGDVAGVSTLQGGIGYPTLSLSGTCSTALNRLTSAGFFQNTSAQPNKAFGTPRYDEFPILVGLFESPNQIGATGQLIDFFREAYNVATHDTNSDGTRAAFSTTTLAQVKLTIPWHSGTVPGSGATRTGVQF